jgi:membrane-bound ClpP family serine protease
MSALGIGVLLLVGAILVILEILILPGFITGIIGVSMTIYGIYLSYITYGTQVGNMVLIGTALFLIVAIYLALKSKMWKRLSLQTELTNQVDNNITQVNVGDCGVSVSRLAPMGKVLINNNYYEAKTKSQFIEPDTEIVVVRVVDNIIPADTK